MPRREDFDVNGVNGVNGVSGVNGEAPQGFAREALLEESAATRVFIVRREASEESGEQERCVCKRLSTRTREDAGARRRLTDEARLLRALAGRGAPSWVASGGDRHGPFVIMERIDAAPLATRVGARVDPVWLARAAVATLRALARVHEASDERGALDVVHGDVSPANILVHEDASRAVMVDFGLARWRDASPDARGEGVAFGGTLLYAAPEVARGERIDARADLFSMALSFFHVASGASPRRVALPTPALLVDAGERSVDSWLRDARSSIALDPDLERALVACASFDPARRPASAREALVRAAC